MRRRLACGAKFCLSGANFWKHLATLSLADSLAITVEAPLYLLLLSCAANVHSPTATTLIHDHIHKNSSGPKGCSSDPKVIGALVHSYGQCGQFAIAVSLFKDSLSQNIHFGTIEWNTLVAYAEHGKIEEAMQALDHMVRSGVKPDEVTTLCLLNAASHAGDKG